MDLNHKMEINWDIAAEEYLRSISTDPQIIKFCDDKIKDLKERKRKNMDDQFKVNEITHNINNEIANCMYDLAEGNENKADDMYNDSNVMSDLFGDRCFEACGYLKTEEDKILCMLVCDKIIEIGHKALVTAVKEFMERRNF